MALFVVPAPSTQVALSIFMGTVMRTLTTVSVLSTQPVSGYYTEKNPFRSHLSPFVPFAWVNTQLK